MAGILFWVVNFFLRAERLFKFDRLKFSTCLKLAMTFYESEIRLGVSVAWSPYVSLQPRPQTLGFILEKIVREEPWGQGW